MHILYIILFFILGSCLGSFYTVIGLRLPRGEDFCFSRSYCDECKHELSLIEMIPIVSYIFLRGRCRWCSSKINSLSTYIEFFTGLLFAVAFYSYGYTYDLLIALGIISLLVIVLVCDLTYLIIPDEILVFFSLYFIGVQFLKLGFMGMISHIGIGIFLFIIMYLIMLIGNKAFKKESMGGGDVKMMFLFGLVLDPLLGVLTIFIGSLFALPLSLYLYFSKQENVIPFGPFLVIAFAFIYFMKLTPDQFIHFLGL
mgnify:FL=1